MKELVPKRKLYNVFANCFLSFDKTAWSATANLIIV